MEVDMKNVFSLAKQEIAQLEKDVAKLAGEIQEKQLMIEKLTELLAIGGEKPLQKRGRKPGSKNGKKPGPKPGLKAAGKKRGPKPGSKTGNKPGPKKGRVGERKGTLPAMIVDILTKAGKPMKAKEITAALEKKGWQTKSGDPQIMVYKTLHRIEKDGVVVKESRGLFTAPAK
jgi:hypothetical protein